MMSVEEELKTLQTPEQTIAWIEKKGVELDDSDKAIFKSEKIKGRHFIGATSLKDLTDLKIPSGTAKDLLKILPSNTDLAFDNLGRTKHDDPLPLILKFVADLPEQIPRPAETFPFHGREKAVRDVLNNLRNRYAELNNLDKQKHPSISLFAGPGAGKSRLSKELRGLVTKKLKQEKEALEKEGKKLPDTDKELLEILEESVGIFITYANGVGKLTAEDQNYSTCEQALAGRLFNAYFKPGMPWPDFVERWLKRFNNLPGFYFAIKTIFQHIEQVHMGNSPFRAIFLSVDEMNALPNGAIGGDPKITIFRTIPSAIGEASITHFQYNDRRLFLIPIFSGTVYRENLQYITSSTLPQLRLALPLLSPREVKEAFTSKLREKDPNGPHLQEMISFASGHPRCLEKLYDTLPMPDQSFYDCMVSWKDRIKATYVVSYSSTVLQTYVTRKRAKWIEDAEMMGLYEKGLVVFNADATELSSIEIPFVFLLLCEHKMIPDINHLFRSQPALIWQNFETGIPVLLAFLLSIAAGTDQTFTLRDLLAKTDHNIASNILDAKICKSGVFQTGQFAHRFCESDQEADWMKPMIGTKRVNLAGSNWSYANAAGSKVDGVVKFVVTTQEGPTIRKHLCIICLQTKQHKDKANENVKALESGKVIEEYDKFLLFKEKKESNPKKAKSETDKESQLQDNFARVCRELEKEIQEEERGETIMLFGIYSNKMALASFAEILRERPNCYIVHGDNMNAVFGEALSFPFIIGA